MSDLEWWGGDSRETAKERKGWGERKTRRASKKECACGESIYTCKDTQVQKHIPAADCPGLFAALLARPPGAASLLILIDAHACQNVSFLESVTDDTRERRF